MVVICGHTQCCCHPGRSPQVAALRMTWADPIMAEKGGGTTRCTSSNCSVGEDCTGEAYCYFSKCSDIRSLHNFPQNLFTRPCVKSLGTWLLFGACTAVSGLSFSSGFVNQLKASILLSPRVVLVPAVFVMGADGLGLHPWLLACPPSFALASFCWLGGWAMGLVGSFWYNCSYKMEYNDMNMYELTLLSRNI